MNTTLGNSGHVTHPDGPYKKIKVVYDYRCTDF